MPDEIELETRVERIMRLAELRWPASSFLTEEVLRLVQDTASLLGPYVSHHEDCQPDRPMLDSKCTCGLIPLMYKLGKYA